VIGLEPLCRGIKPPNPRMGDAA